MKKVCIVHETGNGRLGGHYIENAFQGLPGVEIAALADSNQDRAVADYIPQAPVRYDDYRNMLEQEKPDIVVLASRLPDEHFEQIHSAIDHHCHVLTEKPFVADLVQADQLITQATENHIQIAIAHLARYAPVFQTMKKMIDAGDIGRVLTCYLRGKEDSRGGGEDMMVLGSHLLDIAVYLFGPPLEVSSDIRVNGRVITSGDMMATDEPIGLTAGDEVMSVYRFPEKINAIFQSHRAIVDRGTVNRMGIVVAGTRASLAVRYNGDRTLRICRDFPVPEEDESRYEIVEVPAAPELPGAEPLDYKRCVADPKQPFQRYYADNNRRAAWDLLQSLKTGKPLLSSAADAVWSLEMITGAYRSAIERRVIPLPQTDRKHPLGK